MKTIQRPPKPHKMKIDKSTFSNNLSALGVCETGDYAYLKLSLESLSLESIQGINEFPHLQHVNLSHNKLTVLKPLSSLKNLLTLDISHNSLTQLFDFQSPANLLYVNASHNEIKGLGTVSSNKSIQKLNLDHNLISEITGIEDLANLLYLSLNSNKITRISRMPICLQYLDLGNNLITKINKNFDKLIFLRSLDLSFNKITSLRGLEELESLMTLKLQENLIRKVNTLDHLVDLALLTYLDLTGNIVCSKQHYRLRVAFKLPQLASLDGVNVAAEEKIKAENLYGLDVEDRKALFEQIFPGQNFIDRRLVTSEMLDLESDSEEEKEVYPLKKNHTDSRMASRTLSNVNSRENIDPVAMSDILTYSKRYVGDLIEKEEDERRAKVSFNE